MADNDIVILSGARTAIGTFGGSLKDVPNTQLATTAVKAAIDRSGERVRRGQAANLDRRGHGGCRCARRAVRSSRLDEDRGEGQ